MLTTSGLKHPHYLEIWELFFMRLYCIRGPPVCQDSLNLSNLFVPQ